MEEWPPEVAQYVAYNEWLEATDILSLCCASEAMREKLLGDAYGQDHFKSLAVDPFKLVERKDYRALRFAIERGRVSKMYSLYLDALDAPDSRLLETLFKYEFPVYSEYRVFQKSILQDRYTDIVFANVDTRNARQCIIRSYCLKGNVERVQHYLKEFDLLLTDNWLLCSACRSDSVELVELFIDHDINKPNSDGMTPFDVACHSNHMSVFEHLLNHHEPTLFNQDGINALCEVLLCRNDAVRKQKFDMLMATGRANVTLRLLHQACSWKRSYIVSTLLDYDQLDVNALYQGKTALACACRYRDPSIAILLMQHPRIDINRENSQALYYTIDHANWETFCALIDLPAIQFSRYAWAAAAENNDPNYLKKMLDRFPDMDVNIRDDNRSALEVAVFNGYENHVKALLERLDLVIGDLKRFSFLHLSDELAGKILKRWQRQP
jgi:ankyrin repeat protein